MTRAADRNDSIAGAIYGMALGDAWGYPTEFMDHFQIMDERPAPPRLLKVTDDTQMSLYNLRAMRRILAEGIDLGNILQDRELQSRVRRIFADEHLEFAVDPDNNRAPGNTVMGALRAYRSSERITGLEGSSLNESKGCGTVMRAPWLGLLPLERSTVIALAILQSQTTHGHSVATLSSAVTALLARDLFEGNLEPIDGPARNRVVAMLYRLIDLANEVGELQSNLIADGEILNGLWDFRSSLENLIRSLQAVPQEALLNESRDICDWFGQGWVGDEALFCAAGALALYGEESFAGINRLVFSNGDSDSIAAVGGSFLGILGGYDALATQARSRGCSIRGSFENRYEDELARAGAFISGLWADPRAVG